MERIYKNPPLAEALCEFQFIPNVPWDLTIPGLIYGRIKDRFPRRKQQAGLGIQLRPTEKGVEHKIEPAPPRVQFLNQGETVLVQLAPDLLVVNQLKPYPGWIKFKSLIIDTFNVYREIANPKGIKRIGLRYINIFEFTSKNLRLDEYFNYYPFIPETMPKALSSFLVRSEFPYSDEKEVLILQLASIIPRDPDLSSLVLDLDYAMIAPEYISLDDIEEWVEKAHDEIERTFETTINDKARDLFMDGGQ